ncbi:MAG: CBS domain-containing protein [Gammaproteobacteria bacterium]|nr:CBS domain-containing protein [Gammaproteobacteria bacterium]MBT8436634.1 CBS domain-containing protein [Gammaproteobacteria bacterium]
MIEQDLIERDTHRVGVEQEMYIVDAEGYPAPISDQLLKGLADDRFTTELARFNLEANLDPEPIGGDFLRTMKRGLDDVLLQASSVANDIGAHIVLTGILPTLNEEHVSLDNLTPEVRYQCLNDTCMAARGDTIKLEIDGVDHFESSHDCAVIEGANTSFQFHLQVAPDEAGALYNLAQLITAPLLAVAANAPVLLNRRVWHETRVALFERTFEYRSTPELARNVPTRVGFGETWIGDSVLDIFRENAMRHHVIMVSDPIDDPFQILREGGIPELSALSLHNGTVWRWNRLCYGITDGKPHLRIENRALPAGPTIVDEVANVALFYGLMQGLEADADKIPRRIAFEDARLNLFSAARHGLNARFTWLDGRRLGARELLLQELIPIARSGLEALQVPSADIDYYLGIIEARTKSGRSGARWLLDSLENVPVEEREGVCRDAVKLMRERQGRDLPVHDWELVVPGIGGDEMKAKQKVSDVMTTNLFTVRPEDLVDLATSTMEWRHVRHVPVESAAGELVGLLSTRELLRLNSADAETPDQPIPVSTVMQPDPLTISPDAPLDEAFVRMLETDSGCLLVVARGQLLGIVTERDLLEAAVKLVADDRKKN